MPGAFDGTVVIVTGGNSGIGRATALRFAAEGARVVIAARRAAACEEVAREVRAAGGTGLAVPTDVSDEAAVEALVDRTLREFGRLDAAFNNAGVGGAARLHECDAKLFDRIHAVNLRGVFLCMKYELRAMLHGGGGSIVNNASAAGLTGHALSPPYASSKHGVIGLTRSAALQYVRDNIRVNAICPGVIGTPMVERAAGAEAAGMSWFLSKQPGGAAGSPDDVAGAVLFLCSAEARFVTGAALSVDGGMTAGFF
ncbi:MAG: glucose 1-dehydrogenase [Phycisphaeraceae bacterium]|nr:glucose 1-dehydrogenase [Phycisphaeraceae bacterium]